MTEIDESFVPTKVGMDYGYPLLINWPSRVQVYGDGYGNFFAAVPTTVRHTGIRAVSIHKSLDEAIAHATTLIPAGVKKMTRLHTEAMRLDKKWAAGDV